MWRGSANVLKYAIRKTHQTVSKLVPTEAPDLNIFKTGTEIHGFKVTNVREVQELKLTAVYLIHERTKAEYLHLYRNDNNNVFSINFRTTPLNSTGLPHILEHTVLCGSQLYPVRDPFFKMLNRSLATFMNAMTGADYTMYPFSTQNLSDFRNLQKIYLDAVFKPNLREVDFMQEGWRLENSIPEDKKSPLIIKGVVYNEMKGVFGENEAILGQKLQNLILPDHTYGVVSGGDPKDIPLLTWEDLKNFHKNHYHPSNSKFYSYGNFPLAPSLAYINENYLSNVEFQSPEHTIVPQQKRWTEPKRQHIEGRFEHLKEADKQNMITISLLLSDITDVYTTFLMYFVSELLLKGPNSPFYRSLIEPNFSGGFTQTTGFDSQSRDSVFTVGLQSLRKEDFDQVLKIFDVTLEEVVRNGFNDEHIEAILHRYELSIKHESANFGLHLLFGLTPTWNHNGDIVTSLQVNRSIEQLKENLKNKDYLKNVVKEYFLDNKHRLVLTMSPDANYDDKQVEIEENLLKAKIKELSETAKEETYLKCLELQKEQKRTENTDILPSLELQDIGNDVEKVPKEKVTINSIPVQVNKVNTNGVVYFKGLLNTADLSPEQQMLLPLFCEVITKLGTDKLNYLEFDSVAQRTTSGLTLSPYIAESLFQLNNYEPSIAISSYCLEKNVDSMWDLWGQIFNLSKLEDVGRFQMLSQVYMANLTQGLAYQGHVYAMQAASALVSGTSYQRELLTGLHHISYMKRLLATSHYRAVLDEIFNIAKILFHKNNLRCAFNIEEKAQAKILKGFAQFAARLPDSSMKARDKSFVEGKVWAPLNAANCQYHTLNVPVYYCSKAVLTAPFTSKEYARLRVLSKLISAKYLHPELRERQGAYGGGAKLSQDGTFTFYSYRDPRSFQTLDIFDDTYKWFQDNLGQISEQEILHAKLGVFQAVDAPIPPSHKGCDEFLRRLTPDILQRHRAELMAVQKSHLQEVVEKYLGGENPSVCGKVILGAKAEKLDTGTRTSEMWTIVDNE